LRVEFIRQALPLPGEGEFVRSRRSLAQDAGFEAILGGLRAIAGRLLGALVARLVASLIHGP
jgi:hypothetical protein